MMIKIYSLLAEVLGVPVYQDFIPEKKPKPAASYLIINRETEKVLKGTPVLRRITVQVSISSDTSRLDCELVCDRLRALDGSFMHSNFQYISIISDTDDPISDTSERIYTTNIELQLTPKLK